MVNISRFQFPGFILSGSNDTPTYEVEVGRIEHGGTVFVLDVIRNKEHTDLSFMVAKIHDTADKLLWAFQKEGFEGVGLLAQGCDGEPVIALVGKGKTGKVERVIPLSKLVSNQPVDLRRMVWHKVEAAKFLDREYVFSTTEDRLIKIEADRKEAEQEATRIAAAKARENCAARTHQQGPQARKTRSLHGGRSSTPRSPGFGR
jgi:hypothetical protein